MDNFWEKIDRTILSTNRIFDVAAYKYLSPDKTFTHDFYILETKDWVNIIPITSNNEIILVNQFRHGSNCFSLELPGGIVDFTGEGKFLQAAKAELRQETGYTTEQWEYLGKVSGNPALFNNWCEFYIAHNVSKTEELELDREEFLNTEIYPIKQIPELILQNKIIHPMMVAALGMYFVKSGVPK